MAIRARLIPPQVKRKEWPWHHAKWTSMSASLLMNGDRRFEAENYLANGYGIRLAMEARLAGWTRLGSMASVWQPSRLKGILVSHEYGTPFLAATQVYDVRPVPRKWVALAKTDRATDRFVQSGKILITRSGNVGRATLAQRYHENIIISDDLLRVEPKKNEWWGWIYAYLRSPQARAMMKASQYGHIIKHLETSHLNALPIPVLHDDLRIYFNAKVQEILEMRDHGHRLLLEAEDYFSSCFGALQYADTGEAGFVVRASESFFSGRRRFDALPHNPTAKTIWQHLSNRGKGFTRLGDTGYSVWLPTRFKRIPAEEGVSLVDSSSLFEVNPDIARKIADGDFGDPFRGRVEAQWLLMARSGQIYGLNGTVTMATEAYENMVISDDIIRIAPLENAKAVREGYLFIVLSHPTLGRPLVKSLAYGSSIPHIEVADVLDFNVVRISQSDENYIADLAERAVTLLAQADIFEKTVSSEAEKIIDRFIAGNTCNIMINM